MGLQEPGSSIVEVREQLHIAQKLALALGAPQNFCFKSYVSCSVWWSMSVIQAEG